jgi:hypothetical protein
MRVAFLSSPVGTPRHRCEHPREQLASQGIEAVVLQGAPALTGYTHAVLNRVPMSPELAAAIDAAESGGTRVLFDVDDLIFDADVVGGMEFVKARAAVDQTRLREAVNGIARTIERCRAGLCATVSLQRELDARGHSVALALNGVSDEMVRLSDAAVAHRTAARGVRIGFPAGHPGHAFNLAVVEEAVEAVLRRYPQATFVLMGALAVAPRLAAFAGRIAQVPYMDWRELPAVLARLDICMAPLADNAFNRCKSDIKFLEAALVRVPVVASPVGQLGETIRHGTNGLLAADTTAWVKALSALIEQPQLREDLAAAAHDYVRRERTSEALGPKLVEALVSAAADARGTSRPSAAGLP